MRGRSAVGTMLLLATALVAVTSSPAGALKGERGNGRGVDFAGNEFRFRARGTGTGLEATGVLDYTTVFGTTIVGEITCMSIGTAGATRIANIGGTVTESSNPALVGLQFVFGASDDDAEVQAFTVRGFFSSTDPCLVGGTNLQISEGRVSLTDNR